MFIRVVFGNRDLIILTVIREQAEHKPGCKKTLACSCNIIFCNKTFVKGFKNMKISVSAVQVASVFDCHSRAFGRSGSYLMIYMKIPDRPAIADHMTLKTPFFTKNRR